jgi:hypothetical protein
VSEGIGTQLHELINAHKMVEYAALKRIALAKGGLAADGTPISALLEKGESDHWQGRALDEFATILKNPDVISGNIKYGTPEFIHIDEIVVALQRMQDDTSCIYKGCSTFVHAKHGTSHLEQALGTKGADDLLRKLYAAQRLGNAAAKKQKIAKWIIAGTIVFAIGIAYWIFS